MINIFGETMSQEDHEKLADEYSSYIETKRTRKYGDTLKKKKSPKRKPPKVEKFVEDKVFEAAVTPERDIKRLKISTESVISARKKQYFVRLESLIFEKDNIVWVDCCSILASNKKIYWPGIILPMSLIETGIISDSLISYIRQTRNFPPKPGYALVYLEG